MENKFHTWINSVGTIAALLATIFAGVHWVVKRDADRDIRTTKMEAAIRVLSSEVNELKTNSKAADDLVNQILAQRNVPQQYVNPQNHWHSIEAMHEMNGIAADTPAEQPAAKPPKEQQ